MIRQTKEDTDMSLDACIVTAGVEEKEQSDIK